VMLAEESFSEAVYTTEVKGRGKGGLGREKVGSGQIRKWALTPHSLIPPTPFGLTRPGTAR
jgi:hypothetical protein